MNLVKAPQRQERQKQQNTKVRYNKNVTHSRIACKIIIKKKYDSYLEQKHDNEEE